MPSTIGSLNTEDLNASGLTVVLSFGKNLKNGAKVEILSTSSPLPIITNRMVTQRSLSAKWSTCWKKQTLGKISDMLCWSGEILRANTTNLAPHNGFWAGDKKPKPLLCRKPIKEFQTVISKRLKLFGGRRDGKRKKELRRTRSPALTLAKKSWSSIGEHGVGTFPAWSSKSGTDDPTWSRRRTGNDTSGTGNSWGPTTYPNKPEHSWRNRCPQNSRRRNRKSNQFWDVARERAPKEKQSTSKSDEHEHFYL